MTAAALLLWLLLAGPGAPAAEDAVAPPAGAEASADWKSNLHLYALVGGMIIIMFTLMRMRRQQHNRTTKMSNAADLAQPPPGRGQVERLTVDLEETARAVSALLDTKIRVLDKLIRDADERIARLGRLTGEPAAGDAADRAPASSPPPAPPPPPPDHGGQILDHHREICSLADQGLNVHDIAEKSGYPVGEVELVLSLRKLKRPDK